MERLKTFDGVLARLVLQPEHNERAVTRVSILKLNTLIQICMAVHGQSKSKIKLETLLERWKPLQSASLDSTLCRFVEIAFVC